MNEGEVQNTCHQLSVTMNSHRGGCDQKLVIGICHMYLTHWGRVTHICVGNLTIIGPDNGLSPARRQAIIWTKFNQWWDIVNWTLRNKLQWNFNQYSYIFIQENSFENVVCEMASILSRPQCDKWDAILMSIDLFGEAKCGIDSDNRHLFVFVGWVLMTFCRWVYHHDPSDYWQWYVNCVLIQAPVSASLVQS